MKRLATVLALVCAAPAHAADGKKLSVTIYNADLALVQDVRPMDIAAGRQRLEF